MSESASLTKRLGLLGGVAAVLVLAVAWVQGLSERRALDLQAQRDLQAARLGFAAQQAQDERLLNLGLEGLLDRPGWRSAFLARDRAGLQTLAQPVFDSLQAGYGVTQLYFLDPPPAATCFLRLHSPGIYGDKVRRATYRQAVAGGVGQGMELGQTAFALRVVRPWVSADGHRVIGFLELGEEIGHFLRALKAVTGNDYALLLDKRRLDPLQWLHMCHVQHRLSDWSERPIYVLGQDTGVLARDLQWNGSLERLPAEGTVLGRSWDKGRCLMRAVFPVSDAAGRRCGAVLVARDVTPLLQQGRLDLVLAELLALLGLVLVAGLAGWILARRWP